MKRPTSRQWAIAMSATTVLFGAAAGVFSVATVGMFFLNYAETDELRGQYAGDTHHYTNLASQYTRYFETHGKWPAPGTYSEDDFQYQSTTTSPPPFDEREDTYYTDYDRGMSVRFELRKDGTIRVWPVPY